MNGYDNILATSLEIDEKKMKKMLTRIYNIERENAKTQAKLEKEIKAEIQSIIEEEAKKCY